jgi:hypothetical protein
MKLIIKKMDKQNKQHSKVKKNIHSNIFFSDIKTTLYFYLTFAENICAKSRDIEL